MDYSKNTDQELTDIRKGMPKYLNDMTPAQHAVSHAVYTEQKRRYDEKIAFERAEYNLEVEKHGFRVGDRVSYFARSMLGIGGISIKGTVGKRKQYYVKLDHAYNGKKSAHLTSAWHKEGTLL